MFQDTERVYNLNEGEHKYEGVVLDISKFLQTDYRLVDAPLMLQLKGFNRKERVQRSSQQFAQGKLGSTNHRKISEGAIMIFNLPSNTEGYELNISEAETIEWVNDSRGSYFDKSGSKLFFASVDEVKSLDLRTGALTQVASSAFAPLAFVHSIDMSTDRENLLLTSSGFDSVVQINASDGQLNKVWHFEDLGKCSENFLLDESNFKSGLGYPPGERKFFPNSALYTNQDKALVTLFHKGIVELDLNNGQYRLLDYEVSHPHAALKFREGYIVTDTGNGNAKILNEDLTLRSVIDFSNLPGNTDSQGRQWLQHVRPVDNDRYLLGVDSNRESIVIVDLVDQAYQPIKYDGNWVVQEAQSLPNL